MAPEDLGALAATRPVLVMCFSSFFFFFFSPSPFPPPPGVDEKTFMRYAGHEKIWEHLQRHALADLFLDINEYNGGTTGLDAYWADVPILSTPIEKFSGFFFLGIKEK